MFNKFILLSTLLLTFSLTLSAKVIITPHDAMQAAFGSHVVVSKKNILLSKDKAQNIQQRAKMKLDTKIYRIFTATIESKKVGYGVLITRKVRSKTASVLYMMTRDGVVKSIEIIAFNEPHEYIPNQNYIKLFETKTINDTLRVGKDIPTISGATLSARNLTDGARLALSIFDVVIKK